MEIKEFKRIKLNIYEIRLNNGEILKLYDDVILKYNLLINKKIDDKLYKEIISYNNSLDSYYLSLKYISNKLRCEKEIRDYLKNKGFKSNIIDDTINKLIDKKYIDREVYIKSYISDKNNFSMDGPNKIKNNLMNLGFREDEIIKYLNYDYSDKIIKIINKKVNCNKKLNDYKLKINISNYLINLGYSKDMFSDYLNNIKIDNSLVINKDYDKLKKKYEKKYSGKELYYLIKNKLYQKGYREDEIGEVLDENIL